MQALEALDRARQALIDACNWMDRNVPRVPGAQIAMNGIVEALRATEASKLMLPAGPHPSGATPLSLSAELDLPAEKDVAEALWRCYCDEQGFDEVEFSTASPSNPVFKQAAAVMELLNEKMRIGDNKDLPPGWTRDAQAKLIPPYGDAGISDAAVGLAGGALDEIHAFQRFKSERGEAAHYESDGLFMYSSTNSEYAAWLHRASIAAEMMKRQNDSAEKASTAVAVLPKIRAAVAHLIQAWDNCGAFPDTEAERQDLHNAIAAVRKAQYPCTSESPGLELRDALRWRALVGSARIKPQGSAGLETPQPGHYAHMGLELWTVYDQGGKKDFSDDNSLGVRWLTQYADIAVRAGLGYTPVARVIDEIKGGR